MAAWDFGTAISGVTCYFTPIVNDTGPRHFISGCTVTWHCPEFALYPFVQAFDAPAPEEPKKGELSSDGRPLRRIDL